MNLPINYNIIQANILKPLNNIFTFPHQSEILVLNSFFFHLMPIGVPKVPFRIPGEEDATWVDI
jgi:hypothetical protein